VGAERCTIGVGRAVGETLESDSSLRALSSSEEYGTSFLRGGARKDKTMSWSGARVFFFTFGIKSGGFPAGSCGDSFNSKNNELNLNWGRVILQRQHNIRTFFDGLTVNVNTGSPASEDCLAGSTRFREPPSCKAAEKARNFTTWNIRIDYVPNSKCAANSAPLDLALNFVQRLWLMGCETSTHFTVPKVWSSLVGTHCGEIQGSLKYILIADTHAYHYVICVD